MAVQSGEVDSVAMAGASRSMSICEESTASIPRAGEWSAAKEVVVAVCECG